MERLETTQRDTEAVLEGSMSAIEFGKFVGGVALELTAREVSLAPCQEFVWMRLSGNRRMRDVLFRGRRATAAQNRDISVETAEGICATG
jgi:hypothetical protein